MLNELDIPYLDYARRDNNGVNKGEPYDSLPESLHPDYSVSYKLTQFWCEYFDLVGLIILLRCIT